MKSIKKAFEMVKNRKNEKVFDYGDSLSRESTVQKLLYDAKKSKANILAYWKKMSDYYDGDHAIRASSACFAENNGLSFVAAQSTDGYIHVETQIESAIPDFEFSPRGDDDGEKAKQREAVVRYICDIGDMEMKNSRNERRLNILGSAVWKVCWDDTNEGEVKIDAPHPEQIFTDPNSKTVDGCEYIAYVYRLHKNAAKRLFEPELRARMIDADELFSERSRADLFGFERLSGADDGDDCVSVTEWWFRQPSDGREDVLLPDGDILHYEWKSGDIGLIILLEGKEVRYIPKYWKNTSFDVYPFVIYAKIPNEKSIWGKSELEMLIPLIDAADREIAFAQYNSAFSSNDIILAEENALCDGCELENSPGAVWKLRPGMMGKVQRLGNASGSEVSQYNNFLAWRSVIQETSGNFDMYQGREPEKVTTATGIALLNERARSRQSLKKIDKLAGFKRLYELIDKTALEHYDNGRIVYIGAARDEKFVFDFGSFEKKRGGASYIPQIDVKIHVGDGLANSKAFTVSALSDLLKTNVNADNYPFVKTFIDLIGIPMRKELCDILDEKYGNMQDDGAKSEKGGNVYGI